MPVKKSKPRTSTSLRRIKKYNETYRSKTVPLWFKKTMPEGAALLEDWLTNQDELEKQIFARLDTDGISGEQQLYYAAFARRLFATCLRFYDATYAKEKQSLKNEFLLRGLDSAELETLIGICDTKCNLVRGIVVTLQDIEDKLDNATWGLAALKALIDDLEAKLDDGSHGLAALKTLIDDLETKLDDPLSGLAQLAWLVNSILTEVHSIDGEVVAIEAKLDNWNFTPARQPDAVLNQNAPVSGQKYTVLDTTVNAVIHGIIVKVTWTVQPTPLEVFVTIDGQNIRHFEVNPISAQNYFAVPSPTQDETHQGLNTSFGATEMDIYKGRSIKIEVAITGGTVSNISSRVKYSKW